MRKKKLTADFIVGDKLPADGPLIKLVDDIVPGESLNTSNESDRAYLVEAFEKYANQAETDKHTKRIVAEAHEILERAGKLTKDRLATFVLLVTTAIMPMMHAQDAAAQRQAKFDEIVRNDQLPPMLAAQLLELINREYPQQ